MGAWAERASEEVGPVVLPNQIYSTQREHAEIQRNQMFC